MKNKANNFLLLLVYIFILVLIFGGIFTLERVSHFKTFLDKIEFASFDFRQTIVSKYKMAKKDIVILAVDDETYEYFMDKYGTWPITRRAWAEIVNGIETVKPKSIIFDMLFLKPNAQDKTGDKKLIEAVKNNDNIFLSMNFDRYGKEIRTPQKIDDKFKLNVKLGSLEDNDYITYSNSRLVMKELSDVTNNIGAINVVRDEDGIIRKILPVLKYQGDYYPNLSLLVALRILGINEISFSNKQIMLDEKHIIPIDETNRCILNWYGASKTFEHISVWKVLNAIQNNDKKFLEETLKDKIVYVGATVTSLSDLKSVPVESNMAGVELHTTFLSNILDNNFIKRAPSEVDLMISFLLAILVGVLVLKNDSVFKSLSILIGLILAYSLISVVLMAKFNIWIALILPIFITIVTFMLVYCEKYILKSRDYEQTYKLAVTDGLTNLYNHRFFQEQLIIQFDNFKRYGHVFSMIILDIDFFKKFNDTYGHQSGDCVLKQVADILKKNSRVSDFACRYGGEEMTLILTNTKKEEAIMVANKICNAIRNNNFTLYNGEQVHVTASIGVATSGKDGLTPEELIAYSDKCLYIAKENGRNQVVSTIEQ